MLPEHLRLTYEDYLTFPDDGKRYEILEGELHVTPAPDTWHQRLSKRLQRAIERAVEDPGLGEVFDAPFDVVFSEITVCQPDLVVFLRDRGGKLGKRGMQGAPPLAAEILSPSSATVDRGRKPKVYQSAGVEEYWIVDPDARTVEVHTLGEPPSVERFVEGQVARSRLLPALGVAVAELFAPPPWER